MATMVARAVSLAILVIAATALIWIGIGFAAFAIAAALAPYLGVAGAAAVAAFVLLLGPGLALVALGRRRTRRRATPPGERRKSDEAVLAVLAELAKEQPLLAVLSAGLFGLADVLMNKRK